MITATGNVERSTTSPAIVTAPRGDLAVTLVPAPTGEHGEYLTLLRGALEQAGIQCITAPPLTPGWARRGSAALDLVHLHWLEFIAPSDATPGLGAAKTARRALRAGWALRELRRRGVAIVWTVHNLESHEPVHPGIERAFRHAVALTADRVIVHSEHARLRVARQMGNDHKIHVVPHGNYVGVYPSGSQSRAQLRAAYGLRSDAFVYLSFGQVRRYKRLPELLTAFRALPGEQLSLLIAGEPRDAAQAAEVRSLADRDQRVKLDLRRIPAAEVAAVHSVADAAVFPYAAMFSSGSVLLALSCGLPVVVPAASTGTEVATPPAVEPIGRHGLTAALRAISGGDQRARRDAALAAAARYDWPQVGRSTAEVYRRAVASAQHRRAD